MSHVVLITGASRGLGLGLACLLAAQRIPMLLTARSQDALARAAQVLRAEGGPVDLYAADAADEKGMSLAFDAAARLGSIGAVVNNAGVLEPLAPVHELRVSDFEAAMHTNVTGVLVGTRLALARRTPGIPLRIVNVSSGAATRPYAGWAAYCSSKAAVSMLTQVTAVENPDVFVASVAPGIIETKMQRTIRATSAERFPEVDRFLTLHREGKLFHPVDAAQTLAWLARSAPMAYAGQLVDAFDKEVRAASRVADKAALERARRMFDALEQASD